MADSWIGATSGDWSDAARWSDGVPVVRSAVVIAPADPGNKSFTVTVDVDDEIGSLTVGDAHATLAIGDGIALAVDGTAAGSDQGTIAVESGGFFEIGGTFALNKGHLNIAAGGLAALSDADLGENSGHIAIASGGTLSVAFGSSTITDNESGMVGINDAGTIDVSGGTLTLDSEAINAAGGSIAASGGVVMLDYTEIKGGMLQTTGSGAIETHGSTNIASGGNILDGSAISAGSTVTVNSGSTLWLEHAITNEGDIVDNGDLNIAGTATLSGGGDITLAGNVNLGEGEEADKPVAATLVNVNNTISGGGGIGSIDITAIVQRAGGTLDAGNGTTILGLFNDADTMTNAGTIEATDGGLIDLQEPLTNTGLLLANDGWVNANFGEGIGGTVDISNGGIFSYSSQTSSATIDFADASGGVFMDASNLANNFTGTVAGLANGGAGANEIVFGWGFYADYVAGVGTASFTENASGTKGVLTLSDNGVTDTITLLGQYSNNFVVGTPPSGYSGFVISPSTVGEPISPLPAVSYIPS